MRGAARRVALLAAAAAMVAGCAASGRPVERPTPAPSPTASPPPSPPSVAASPAAGRPGPSWRIPRRARGGIEGYAARTSVRPGERVALFVSTRARRFVVRAFRMGWYGGRLGRLVWTSPPVPGRRQPGPVLRPRATRTVTAPWRRSTVVPTAGWRPGDYLLRLDTPAGHESYVPLAVRAPSAAGRVVLLDAVTTWQAYNRWGCCDLYAGRDGSFATRSRAVSFDRPYLGEHGAGEFLVRELGVVAEAERLGLRLDYLTDVDLARHPGVLVGAHAVVSMGHDEYWSVRMRRVLTAARATGTNLAFLGANAVFRRIRLSATRLGPDRLETDYKVAAEDPYLRTHPRRITADWPAPPYARPESSLVGEQYGCFSGRRRFAGVVADARSRLFAGTGARRGTRLPGLVGPEVDAVQPGYPAPPHVRVLLHSPVHCPGGFLDHQDSTYYVARSGAGVFDAGTIDWACAVRGGCHASGPTHRIVRRVTDNLLRVFASGPAGLPTLPPSISSHTRQY